MHFKQLLCAASFIGAAFTASQPALSAIQPDRSLMITETQILNQFSAQAIFEKLLADEGDTNHTAQDILNNWPGCQNAANQTFNGFPVTCRSLTLGNINNYRPIALTNRFDLANDQQCGEYRIAFADILGTGEAINFMIFEAQLPNPSPSLGKEGCRPIAEFWAILSANNNTASRGTALKQFYFEGINGIPAVFNVNHFAGGENGSGQIRLNHRNSRLTTWSQFEFRTIPNSGSLVIAQSTVKDTPFDELASDTSTHPLAGAFKSAVLDALTVNGENLLANTMSDLSINLPDNLATGSSISDEFGSDVFGGVLGHFDAQGSFANDIQNQLNATGSALTPQQVIARVNSLSCGGCHNQGQVLGGNINFISNRQVSEFLNFTPTTLGAPTKIEAESFSSMSGVQTETTTDIGGGQNVGWLDAGDWMTYNVTLPPSNNGQYEVRYRIASPNNGGKLQLESQGGSQVFGQLDIPKNGTTWQSWTTMKHTVSIPANTTTLAIAVINAGWNINWIEIRGNGEERYEVKPTLQDTFIPERKTILEDFLAAACTSCNNLVQNGDFEQGANFWQTYQQAPAVATFDLNNPFNDARIFIDATGNQNWNIQFHQAGLALTQGQQYRVSFDAMTFGKTTQANIDIVIEQNGGNYTAYTPSQTVSSHLGGTHHEFTFTMQQNTDNDSRITFNLGSNTPLAPGLARAISIDNVQVTPIN